MCIYAHIYMFIYVYLYVSPWYLKILQWCVERIYILSQLFNRYTTKAVSLLMICFQGLFSFLSSSLSSTLLSSFYFFLRNFATGLWKYLFHWLNKRASTSRTSGTSVPLFALFALVVITEIIQAQKMLLFCVCLNLSRLYWKAFLKGEEKGLKFSLVSTVT